MTPAAAAVWAKRVTSTIGHLGLDRLVTYAVAADAAGEALEPSGHEDPR